MTRAGEAPESPDVDRQRNEAMAAYGRAESIPSRMRITEGLRHHLLLRTGRSDWAHDAWLELRDHPVPLSEQGIRDQVTAAIEKTRPKETT